MASKVVIQKRLAIKEKQLELAYDAYTKLLTGQVKAYGIGTRNLTKFDLPQLEETIATLEKEVDGLTAQLNGGSARRAVRALPRDL